MSFCTITPSRGTERSKFLNFCKYQISRMTVKPDKSYFIDYTPVNEHKDLIPRIQEGIRQSKADGFDEVFILEDDDFYQPNYFEFMSLKNLDFIGSKNSLYYNIANRTYEHYNHPDRSSLYCTGFRISALRGFQWPEQRATFLDLKLWRFAKRQYKKLYLHSDALGVSIKHGVGLSGGSGHSRVLKHSDPNFEFLKSKVDEEAYQFYTSIV